VSDWEARTTETRQPDTSCEWDAVGTNDQRLNGNGSERKQSRSPRHLWQGRVGGLQPRAELFGTLPLTPGHTRLVSGLRVGPPPKAHGLPNDGRVLMTPPCQLVAHSCKDKLTACCTHFPGSQSPQCPAPHVMLCSGECIHHTSRIEPLQCSNTVDAQCPRQTHMEQGQEGGSKKEN